MDETTDKTQCAECGTDVPPDAPLGLCPACLLKRAMAATTAGGAGAGRSSGGGWHGGFDPPPVEQLVPLFPQLEILEFIGRGGMGAVYKARQPHLDRFVAVKILPTSIADDPAFAERFAREARSLARLNHANIVTVHDFGRAGEFFFFVMEFVDGLNLRHALLAKTLEPRQALAIVPQICDALQYAHDEGIVHRDIKPENVLLDKRGRVKIADFGLAKLLQKTPQNYTLTQTAVTMGTPHYMAPEQTERPLEVDHRADIYSLGVVFYEMLTGELPLGRFAAPSEKAHIDARLDEVVFKTLEKEPSRRYQQASEVKTSVQGCSTPPPLPPGAGEPEPVLPYAQRHVSSQPNAQYSRVAWAGLIWGAVGFASLLVPIAIGASLGAVAILMFPFMLVALSAIVGMPLCGLIAISQIHRSNGQITGLRMATFDALAFPLLIANAVTILCLTVIPARALDLSVPEALAIVTAIGLPVCVVLDFFIVRFAWRRISAAVPEDAPAVAPTAWSGASRRTRTKAPQPAAPVLGYGEGARYSRTALAGAAWAVIGLVGPLLIAASYLALSRSAAAVVAAPAPRATAPGAAGGGGTSYGRTTPVPGSVLVPAVPVVPQTIPPRSTARGGASSGGGGGGSSRTIPARPSATQPAPARAPGAAGGGGGAVPLAPVGAPGVEAVEQSDPEQILQMIDNEPFTLAPATAPSQPPRPPRSVTSSYVARSGGGSGGSRGSTPGAYGGSTTIVPGRIVTPAPAPAPATPTWAMIAPAAQLALFPLLAVAFTAPFGTTILGLVAISQIRQSVGRLYGMPLAIFDTLVFPLLLLDALIVGGTTAVLTHGSAGGARTAVATLIGIAAAIIADVWIVRRVKDAATTAPATVSS